MAENETPRPTMPDNVRRSVTWFTVVLGITVVLYLFSIPLSFGMLVTAPIAIVMAIRILILTRKNKAISGFRLSITLGMAMAGFSLLMGVTMVVFQDTIVELQNCMERAVTNSAQAQCEADYEDAINGITEDIYERFGITAP
ncbi:hypothetical protein [Demequina globuliformis]|uniref:hypothetical protein n=1 Tax=Demequina globuliformis TaxID=676202 RepID=UPI000780A45B|nr:hypothetical protein [Demequina globuliformis]